MGTEHFAEDLNFPLRHITTHIQGSTVYPYYFCNIDEITNPLGVPWELMKDVPFSSMVTFTGLEWDLDNKSIALPSQKMEKYHKAIMEWKSNLTHSLKETRKLYGKLLYACHIVPQGRAYLIQLEKMMANFHN